MTKLYALLSVFLFGCVACGLLSDEQAATVSAVLLDLRDAGKITEEQYQALLQALSQSPSWDGLLDTLGTIGGSVLLSLTGVQLARGPSAPKAERVARIQAKVAEKIAS